MAAPTTSTHPFVPGTTGWSVDDLSDPAIEVQWEAGHYEIIEGALVTMPAAYYDAVKPFRRLIRLIERHLEDTSTPGELVTEVDLVLSPTRVVRADAAFLRPEDEQRQRESQSPDRGRPGLAYGRLVVPPTLIIENISLGQESHDRVVKRRWYAEANVPNYWVFDPFARSLECVVLEGSSYRIDVVGHNDDTLTPALFPGLALPLKPLWMI